MLRNYLKPFSAWFLYRAPRLAAEWNTHKRQTWIRQQARAVEIDTKEKRKASGKTVIGKKQLFEEDPRNRPENPKKSGKEPLCHASDPELAKEYKESRREFRDRYIPASADYRSGNFDREFPDGSCRPPLISIYTASEP